MNRFVVLASMLLGLVSFQAQAGVAFKCQGHKSRFEVIQGFYNGEAADSVSLKTSSVYGISKLGQDTPGNALELKRTNSGKKYSEYPIKFSWKLKDPDLGVLTSIFAIPLGVFGGGVGKSFKALLNTGDEFILDCETVDSVDFSN